MAMRIINVLLALMFVAFAYLQLNDPDPLLWVLIYSVMVLFCVLAIFGIYPKSFLYLALGILGLYSIFYIPGVLEWLSQEDKSTIFDEMAKEEHHYIEESREFLGLFICVMVLLFYSLRSRK